MDEQIVKIEVDESVTLRGAFTPAQREDAPGAVVLHPHPLYGGSMHNNVVETLVAAAVDKGWGALRFNFRGVGGSSGEHDQGRGEQEDVLAAAAWLAQRCPGPLVLMGYSFGSLVGAAAASRLDNLAAGVWVAPPLILGNLPDWPSDAGPLLMVTGDRDSFSSLEGLKEYAGRMGARVSLVVFENGDHFFVGRESALFDEVSGFLSGLDFMAH